MKATMKPAKSFIDLSIQNTATPLQPIPPSERIPALDVVRGFALFGVLLAYTLWNLGSPPEETYSNFDRILNWVLSALIDTKFYTLFAFLFGLGFSIQLTRAEVRGISIVPLYCRRLLALLLIGLTHALLLRNGDILVPYAVMGFVLLLFRNASNKTLAVGAIIGLVFPYLARSAWDLTGIPFPQRPEAAGASYLAENYAWVRYWYSTAIPSWPASLPMFLFGLYMGRRRFFENIAAHRRELQRALVVGLIIGALAYVSRVLLLMMRANSAPFFAQHLTLRLLWSAHAWGLAAFYASFLLLLMQRRSWQQRLAPLGAVGRMALTNYILQALIIVPVCIGFNLFDRVTPSLGVLLALAVWSVQVPASVWWLRRFRFGPAEWLWRSLTYGRPQPMRVADEPAVAASAFFQVPN
ncbi:DUF418 domain-containing protein [candidate division KSB1 bacterium]|nr:DUF418 domain-containing protein [candidate division KSB1 bacterium]